MVKKNKLEPAQQNQENTIQLVSSPNTRRLRTYIKSHGWLRVQLPNLNPYYWSLCCPDLFHLPEILQAGHIPPVISYSMTKCARPAVKL